MLQTVTYCRLETHGVNIEFDSAVVVDVTHDAKATPISPQHSSPEKYIFYLERDEISNYDVQIDVAP